MPGPSASIRGPAALVTTGTDKFYSNGFEPERLLVCIDDVEKYLLSGQQLFARISTLDVPTVAALQGHTYAAGAIFAMAHDIRIMRADRGYFCLPEVNLGAQLATWRKRKMRWLPGTVPTEVGQLTSLPARDQDQRLQPGIDGKAPPQQPKTLAIAGMRGEGRPCHCAGALIMDGHRRLRAAISATIASQVIPSFLSLSCR
ncbi:enoyl-CoA hydratase/isomerase family protein [Mycobacteroides abscessus]|uniref:enoyl-CoA hydratase/isomerase family protein n=1 Tax=Mycobacteroides abscessus TaxID=36809 RepID=UPI00036979DF|nr:enoyl-CoA hydratase/isomerase family protein [Mycobacteroides abscessus]